MTQPLLVNYLLLWQKPTLLLQALLLPQLWKLHLMPQLKLPLQWLTLILPLPLLLHKLWLKLILELLLRWLLQ